MLLWMQFIDALHPNWQGYSYYDFGWCLAPAVGYLATLRWRESPPSPGFPRFDWWPWIVIALLLLALWPVRIVEQVDPFWRLPLWLHSFLLLLITHLTLWRLRGLRVSFHLLPATLLILLAVPLPSFLEFSLVSFLTDWVVSFTSVVLPLAGYPAEQLGNSFIVQGMPIDVAQGCSGIRSFQSCIAVALVLGELQRLSLWGRCLLLTAAILVAVASNTGRVFLLVRMAHEKGTDAMNAAHDALSLQAVVVTYVITGILSWLFDRGGFHSKRKARHPAVKSHPLSRPSS